ncbi:M23 family metallopeptidase [Tenacibaculum sp. SG-28]|uniref:M23 family metallopeptidase n=1 Tax=Tenacibaculum sp. SG-28 TaxID=754426 RepID=UPI000D47F4E8|nr:M23 family metallopeptidase [Tenacibaculum sp. SG-28]PQJ19731.1 peptidase M23 [Tenacibaculum sp. SG-28]
MKFYTLTFLLLCNLICSAQEKYPRDYFAPPLKIPIVLSGTFGELRSNHFHSGIDIKTQGKEGIPIYAPADGFVSRIKIGQYGFGKALYMKHPNGYTTVYAHLQKFEPSLEEYIKAAQYKKQKYAVGNLFPDTLQFAFKKGELLGYTGDTGSSGGPHLHYEIRDSKTEHIINPLLFGITPKDNLKPTMRKVIVYPLSADATINNTHQKTSLELKEISTGNFITNRIEAAGTIGFGVSVFDQLNGAANKNGIFSLEMKVNGSRVYYHDVETFSFSESKYINLLIDYAHYKRYKQRFQKTHKFDNNKLSLYKDLINDGKLEAVAQTSYNVEIIAKDINGNEARIKIPIKGVTSKQNFQANDSTNYKIIATKFAKFSKENVTIAFPKNTFYEDQYIDFKVNNGLIQVHNTTIPLDKRYTLTIGTERLNAAQKNHVYIANVTNAKYPRYVATKKKENKVYTSTKALGDYKLMFDYEAPEIALLNFYDGQWISNNKTLKVKIKDSESGIKNYRATLDNKWILMELNHKKGILTYNFKDKPLVGSKHIFNIVVSDNAGNTKTLKATFYKK